MPKIIIIYGAPGSGKGTQANKLAEHFNLEHIETSNLIENLFNNPDLQDNIIKREKKLFDKGELCTPEWITGIVKDKIKELHKLNKNIIFSGSPRTLYEAKEIIPVLEELYNKENINIIKLIIKPETSIFRNSNRRICKQCRSAIVYNVKNKELKKCPKCGGKLVKRILDKPETIKIRLQEFRERTELIFNFLKGRSYNIIDINGELSVENVFKSILEKL